VILTRAAARLEDGGNSAERSRQRLEQRAARAAEQAEVVRRIVAAATD
jgi:hypothetical protein